MRSAGYWIQKLQLSTHIEGGAFREIYRSALTVSPEGFAGERNYCTSIYFLLQQHQFSAFHKIKSDETWHFYYGHALIVYEIDSRGNLIEHLLGNDPDKGESFQCVIKAGNWFAARVAGSAQAEASTGENAYTLCGCTVSPGFDFADFELAKRDQLLSQFPQHAALISALTI